MWSRDGRHQMYGILRSAGSTMDLPRPCKPRRHRHAVPALVLAVCVHVCLALFCAAPAPAAETSQRTAGEIQARWVQLMPSFIFDGGPNSKYVVRPSLAAPYAAGSLAPGYLQDGINYLNYVRYLAGLPDDVTLDAAYNNLAQHGAVLSWVSGIGLTHTPAKPADMEQAFYDTGLQGTRSSNIASGGGLRGAIEAFMGDDDPSNVDRVGHRRWLLNPAMQKTGMGDAFRVLVYAHDRSRAGDVPYDVIAWPGAGLFPVEMFSAAQWWGAFADPWSITLNPDLYWWTEGTAGHTVTLRRRGDGRTWTFTSADADPSGEYFTLDTGAYGVANCFIFRPDPATLDRYEVGDTFDVTLLGHISQYLNTLPHPQHHENTSTPFSPPTPLSQDTHPAPYPLSPPLLSRASGRTFDPTIRSPRPVRQMIHLSLGLDVTEGALPVPFWMWCSPPMSLSRRLRGR